MGSPSDAAVIGQILMLLRGEWTVSIWSPSLVVVKPRLMSPVEWLQMVQRSPVVSETYFEYTKAQFELNLCCLRHP